MAFEVEGKLHKKYEIKQVSGTFQSRNFVLKVDDGKYPQYVEFQLVQDRCALVDTCKEGDTIKVHFDLRGREWNGKYITNLNAWKIDKASSGDSNERKSENAPFPSEESLPAMDSSDDLPF